MEQLSHADLCNDFFNHLQLTARKKINYTQSTLSVIKKLAAYFAEQDSELSLNKGIYIYGPVGTGKTTMMRAFSTWRHTKKRFQIVNTKDLQWDFAKEGFDLIRKYSSRSYEYKRGFYDRSGKALTYCFDDFGSEGKSKHYGNDCLVMEEVIEYRYREHQETGMLTHITSNLGRDWDLIENEYGTRIRSRCRELFHKIELDMEDNRK